MLLAAGVVLLPVPGMAAGAEGEPELPGYLASPLALRLAAQGLALPPAWAAPVPAAEFPPASVPGQTLFPAPGLAPRLAVALTATTASASALAEAEGDPSRESASVAAEVTTPGVLPALVSAAASSDASPNTSALVTGRKVRHSRQFAVGALLAWGLLQWDYGQRSPHLARERWFQADTDEGGADKLGHFYTAQVLVRSMAWLYRRWGLEAESAAREAALTSVLVTAVIEVGDGFSPYGVSGEDMVMNLAGAWAGLALARSPEWQERVDLRVEYDFSDVGNDISTDYENARFLVALKPAGFAGLRDTPLRWLELQAGYFARGYDDPLVPDRRVPYVAVGLNLPLLLRGAGLPRVSAFLQFYQPPDSSWRLEDPR